jgi:hypothetical protein
MSCSRTDLRQTGTYSSPMHANGMPKYNVNELAMDQRVRVIMTGAQDMAKVRVFYEQRLGTHLCRWTLKVR